MCERKRGGEETAPYFREARQRARLRISCSEKKKRKRIQEAHPVEYWMIHKTLFSLFFLFSLAHPPPAFDALHFFFTTSFSLPCWSHNIQQHRDRNYPEHK
jgi:uncharacterized membrane protein